MDRRSKVDPVKIFASIHFKDYIVNNCYEHLYLFFLNIFLHFFPQVKCFIYSKETTTTDVLKLTLVSSSNRREILLFTVFGSPLTIFLRITAKYFLAKNRVGGGISDYICVAGKCEDLTMGGLVGFYLHPPFSSAAEVSSRMLAVSVIRNHISFSIKVPCISQSIGIYQSSSQWRACK